MHMSVDAAASRAAYNLILWNRRRRLMTQFSL